MGSLIDVSPSQGLLQSANLTEVATKPSFLRWWICLRCYQLWLLFQRGATFADLNPNVLLCFLSKRKKLKEDKQLPGPV